MTVSLVLEVSIPEFRPHYSARQRCDNPFIEKYSGWNLPNGVLEQTGQVMAPRYCVLLSRPIGR